MSADRIRRHRYYDPDVEKVVPKDAVVLDLDSAYGCSAVSRNPALIVAALKETNSVAAHDIADQIEAQTKSRIPEPGEWAVVEATIEGGRSRHSWVVRRLMDGDADWQDGAGDYHRWDDLIDPVLIREGVES